MASRTMQRKLTVLPALTYRSESPMSSVRGTDCGSKTKDIFSVDAASVCSALVLTLCFVNELKAQNMQI